MGLRLDRIPIATFAAILCLMASAAPPTMAQTPSAPSAEKSVVPAPVSPPSLEERLRQLEQNQAALLEQNRQLSSQLQKLQALPSSPQEPKAGPVVRRRTVSATDSPPTAIESGNSSLEPATSDTSDIPPPIVGQGEKLLSEHESSTNDPAAGAQSSSATYEDGLVFRLNSDEFPFELKINGQNQIRYTGFYREENTWTDSAGNVSPIVNRSAFELPRGRLIFTGYAFEPELLYDLNIDYNTVSSTQINFRSYWLGYRFNRAMTIYAGQNKVPGGREWLVSSTQALGPDRSMATTFFRPSLSQGVWAIGEPVDGVHYHAMMSNGFNTLGSTPDELNSRMTFSGSIWFEPWGDFGDGYSDYQDHESPVIRYGTSLTYARISGPQGTTNVPENSEVRLSDGTVITELGAFAPGATLTNYDIGLATFDFAYKHRGFSFSTELYLQDLRNLQATAPLPESSVFQYGGFVQAGRFVIPKKIELYARTSHVTGPTGVGSEYAGGVNWFILPDKENLKFTVDIANLDHSPADQNRTDYMAGQTGWLLRTQIQVYY